ncbi:MAG TPA: CHAT domain-containing protein [Pirellulaceae bacterium]|nr:CHAT domain-containing protein [Pirellulaceae bacterium]
MSGTLLAQGNGAPRTYPTTDYMIPFVPYYEGDFNTARKAFQDVARGGMRSIDGSWVDSICYHTMLGECYYQLGDRAQALDQYTSALRLFVGYKDWMLRVQFPDSINVASAPQLANITWGKPTRNSTIGAFPDTMLCAMGQLDNSNVVKQGGVVQAPQYLSVRVAEINRCVALSIARRRDIMGPVCEHDPFTAQLLGALSIRPAPANHWSQAWISVQLGLAYACAGKKKEAAVELAKGLQVANRFDHPLTPLALLELGKLAFAEQQYDIAATMFYEATFPAVAFGQYDVIEESLRWGQLTHIVTNRPGVYAPLVNAQAWAKVKGTDTLEASIAILTAENLNNLGNYADAANLLGQATRIMGRSEMQAGQMGARFNYETARAAFGQGKLAPGNTALNLCMAFQKVGSRRLFQIGLADSLYMTQQIRVDRIAELLYDDVLREPTAADWLIDPMETMTVATTPHFASMEHWFEVAVKRKQAEKAAEIADRIRRHRFYSTMPTGGRVLSLRWILEAPEEILPDPAKLQRRDLLAKFPKLAALSKEALNIQAQLAALPRIPADAAAAKAQGELFLKLAAASTLQELAISDIALRREPSDFIFPPLMDTKELQKRLRSDQLVLAYFTTTRYVVGFAITKDSCKMWQLNATGKIKEDMAALFKAWGHIEKNFTIASTELGKDEWKPIAARLLTQLSNGAKAEHFDNFKELIIVPDGLIWYIPFEALQLGEPGATFPLISKVRMRYAPTLGLALPDARVMPANAQSAIVAGRMFLKEDPTIPTEAAEELAKKLPGAYVTPATLTAPGSLYSALLDRLVVFDDVDDVERGPYDWAPLRSDKGKPAANLSQWALLPWRGPQQVILPGYHTPVENGLKKGGTGDDIFLSVMGLMASGTRTVLLSRWRTGGQTGYDLTREFVQELPHTSAANAWQRSVQLITSAPLDISREPRLRAGSDESLTADHPFFWAGYLLVDTGVDPAPPAP